MILDTGFINLTSFANDSSVGTLAWANPANAASSNDVYAVAQNTTAGDTQYLRGLQLVSSGIPTYAIIVGVEVQIERTNDGDDLFFDNSIRLFVGGVPSGDEKSAGATWQVLTDEVVTFGGASDLWGLNLTPAQVLASDFGFGVSGNFQFSGSGTFGRIDHMQMKIYYDPSRMFLAL